MENGDQIPGLDAPAAQPKNKGGRPRKSASQRKAAAPKAPRAPTEPRAPAPVRADNTVEITYWNSVQNSRDPGDVQLYLDNYPTGLFVEIAERRVRQLLQAEAQGGEPEMYTAPVKRQAVIVPTTPIPHFTDGEEPRYLLLADFFAENDTKYDRDQELVYYGPPNEHMQPLNNAARRAKREQEDYLDACWAVKCKAEGRPVAPRPKEMADQIEAEMQMLKGERGGVAVERGLPPTRPDLAKNPRANPNADRVGAVTQSARYGDRASNATVPVLGRSGDIYQRPNEGPKFGGVPQPAPGTV